MLAHPLMGGHGRPPVQSLAIHRAGRSRAGLFAAIASADVDRNRSADVVLARSALAAIDGDPFLREVNLVVSVVDRVAVIGGPVPSSEVGQRAEWLVRRVPGIEDVSNRCFVQAGPDPLLRVVAERTNPRRSLPELPGVVPNPRTGFTSFDTPAQEPAVAAAGPIRNEVTTFRPANPSSDPLLLSPVGPEGLRAGNSGTRPSTRHIIPNLTHTGARGEGHAFGGLASGGGEDGRRPALCRVDGRPPRRHAGDRRRRPASLGRLVLRPEPSPDPGGRPGRRRGNRGAVRWGYRR